MADSSVFFKIICENKGKHVLFSSTFQLQQSTYEKEAYPFLKQIFDKIYGMINDQIIFKKT
jgi:hypothetical protein